MYGIMTRAAVPQIVRQDGQHTMKAKGTHDVTPNTIIIYQFMHRENNLLTQAARRKTIVIVIV